MKKRLPQLLLLLAMGLALYFISHPAIRDYVTVGGLKAHLQEIKDFCRSSPSEASTLFFLAYFFASALSVPWVAAILTVAAGAIFEPLWGFVLVSFASSLGALAAMLIARFLMKNWIERNFKKQIAVINRGMKKDGNFYLFSLRLAPFIPFFAVNMLMGLTSMKATTFYVVSQVGMIPVTVAYVLAGTQLSKIETARDILTPEIFGTLIFLALLPLALKWLLRLYMLRKKTKKPR